MMVDSRVSHHDVAPQPGTEEAGQSAMGSNRRREPNSDANAAASAGYDQKPLFVNEPIPTDQEADTPDSDPTLQRPESPPGRPRPDSGGYKNPAFLDIDIPTIEFPAPDDAVDEKVQPITRSGSGRDDRRRWAAMGLLAVIAIAGIARTFGPDKSAARASTEPPAPTTPRVAAPPVVVTLPPVATVTPTVPPTTPGPFTPTPPARAPAPTTTTTTTTEPPPFIEPVGNPVPVEDLTLSILGIGSLNFGNSATRVLGTLASSLGQPDIDTGPITGGALGTCADGTYRVVGWDALKVITRWDGTRERFDSFRVDLRGVASAGPGATLQTLSGFRAGATIGELREIYTSGFRIAFSTNPAEGMIYQLSSSQGLLLW
jgi:hypothetical protein